MESQKTNVFDRLLVDSISPSIRKEKLSAEGRNTETKRWETLLSSTGKLTFAKASRPSTSMERPTTTKLAGLSSLSLSLPPSSLFLSFPKEKTITEPKNLNNGIISTRNFHRSLSKLSSRPISKSKIDLMATPQIMRYPVSDKIDFEEYKPMSATLIALERFRY